MGRLICCILYKLQHSFSGVMFACLIGSVCNSVGYAQDSSLVTRNYYAGTDRLKSEIRNGVETSYTYTNDGDIDSITNAVGQVIKYSNYKRGIAQTEVQAYDTVNATTIYREVDDLGCIVSETDGESNRVAYETDSLCRVTSIVPAKSGSTSISIAYTSYSGSTPETHTITRGNLIEVRKFDGFGRILEKISGGVKRTWGYDVLGRRTFESYPAEASVVSPGGDQLRFDGLDRLIQIKHSDDSSSSFQYMASAVGLPVKRITDERLNVTTYSFRAFGDPSSAELMSIEAPVVAANVAIERNVIGQPTKVIQGGVERTYGYDSRFYLISMAHPETGSTAYGRDAIGRLTSVAVASSGLTHYEYNDLNQVISIKYPDSNTNVTQTWYKNGFRKSASNGVSALDWIYDDNGNLTQETLSINGHVFTTDYHFDGNDRLSGMAYPKQGSVLDFAPDILGRPTKLGDYATGIDYHPNGLVSAITYGNSVKTSATQDNRQRPWVISVGRNGGNAYVGMTFGYDAANNVKSVVDGANSYNNRSYSYDGIDRLVNVVYGGTSYVIEYDGVGNIKYQNFGGVINYNYDAATNRLTSTTGAKSGVYAYDARGNVVHDGKVGFQYDDNSRLRCAKCGTVDQILYEYDALGKRLSRSKGGNTTYLVYGKGGELLMEFDPNNNIRQEHVYLRGQKVATRTQSIRHSTSINLNASAGVISPGESITLTATVAGGDPKGEVKFYDNGVYIGSGVLVSGVATFATGALNFGYHKFSAIYGGDEYNVMSAVGGNARVEVGKVSAAIVFILGDLF